MEEFISKNKLIKELIDKGFYPAIVKSAIENAPIENVVPKSEYEKLEWQFKELDIECNRLEKDEENFHKAKQEVAREIFEHMKKRIHHEYTYLADNVPNDDDYYLGKLAGISEAEIIIAECEKKYIGE